MLSTSDRERTVLNSWAGTTSQGSVGPFYTIRGTVEGPIDPKTGYVCDIKVIDRLLLRCIAEPLADLLKQHLAPTLSLFANVLKGGLQEIRDASESPVPLVIAELGISPHTRLAVQHEDPFMVRLTQCFEFSAAHRLFRDDLSDEENRRLFGKCSNPAGHGHNYVLEVTVAFPNGSDNCSLATIDRIVEAQVIEHFDHKNLNIECADFASLNPTVENIARVIWNRLDGKITECRLIAVRVWETPKTYAEYTGDAA